MEFSDDFDEITEHILNLIVASWKICHRMFFPENLFNSDGY